MPGLMADGSAAAAPEDRIWQRPDTEPAVPWLVWVALPFVLGTAGVAVPEDLRGWGVASLLAVLLGVAAWAALGRHPAAARALVVLLAWVAGSWWGAAAAGGAGAPDEDGPRLLAVTGTVQGVLWLGHGQGLWLSVDASDDPGGYRPQRLLVEAGPMPAVRSGEVVTARGLWRREQRGERLRASELERTALREAGPRGWAWSAIDRLAVHQELAGAMLLGVGSPPEKPLFRATGLLHVLVVSGSHLVAAAALGAWILRQCGMPWGARQVLLIGLVGGYTWLTGASPATVRALVMTVALLLAGLLGRQSHRLGAVSLAALVLVLWDSGVARDLGFQLSLSAVLGILTLGLDLVRLREARWPLAPWPLDRPLWRGGLWLLRAGLDGLLIGTAATLATLPVLALHLGTVAPWAPLATLLVTPAATLAVWAGLPLLVLAGLAPGGPWDGLRFLVEGALDAMVRSAEVAAWLPGAREAAPPPAWVVAAWPLLFVPLGLHWRPLALRGVMAALLIGAWSLASG